MQHGCTAAIPIQLYTVTSAHHLSKHERAFCSAALSILAILTMSTALDIRNPRVSIEVKQHCGVIP